MHCDSLGLLDHLLHVVMLLFSCVSREDGKLVELDAIHELNPGFHANALVGLAIHANPGVLLCVHFINDSVPLHLRLADNKATEQLVSLLGQFNSDDFLGLEGLVKLVEFLLSCFFCGHSLVFREIEERAHLLPNCIKRCKGFLDFSSCSLLLNQMQDGNDVDQILLVVTRAVGRHLELGSVRKLNLYLFRFPLLKKISRGNIRDGPPNGRRALLAFNVLEAFRRGLEVRAHSKLPEQSL
jgi:hypothetical protein